MRTTSRPLLVRLAVILIVWYLALAYLPQAVGTCLDGACSFTVGEIFTSFSIPLAIIALPVLLEMYLYKKDMSQALSDIGLTRFSWTGIGISAISLLPLLLFFPLFALLTSTPLTLQPSWQWLILNVLLVNGLAEEIMMRGFVFRHLREGRPFWRAATLSTVYFAAYHLVLIFTAGPLIGTIAVVTAIPAGFLTAYVYERGNNTIWGPAVLHTLYNGPAFVFALPTDVQPISGSLYLLVGIAVSTLVLLFAYQTGFNRGHAGANTYLIQSTGIGEPLAEKRSA
jgi:membrane protease YdiL (CAAX protease family)